MTTQKRRLEKLEDQMTPNIIDIVFVDAAQQKTRVFQVKIPMSEYTERIAGIRRPSDPQNDQPGY
jgi:hypothetical protein